MSQYTPDTASLRYAWRKYRDQVAAKGNMSAYSAEFDRWLAEHDAEAKAEAWDEARNAKPQFLGPDNGHYSDCMGWEDCHCESYPNPYRKAVE
jgi:hypothetical protein